MNSDRSSTDEDRDAMAGFIVSVEGRRDKQGHLCVYKLPEGDGGGTFEIAGINDRYHPEAASKISELLGEGKYAEAESYIRQYLVGYTDVVKHWTEYPAIEAFLRDCAFNRGPKGALRILQIALNVADDGKWGPKTKSALASAMKVPGLLLQELRVARESYEIRVAPPVGARAKFWKGLVNRWDKALAFSETLLA